MLQQSLAAIEVLHSTWIWCLHTPPVCLLIALPVIMNPQEDPSGLFANATTVKDGYHLSFLGNILSLAPGKLHLTSSWLLCGSSQEMWYEFKWNLWVVGFSVSLKGVSGTGLENYIKPHNQAGKCLFMPHAELDLSNHAVPRQSGRLVIERSVDVSQ